MGDVISAASNPLLKAVRKLAQHKTDERFIVEGERVVAELYTTDLIVEKLFIVEKYLHLTTKWQQRGAQVIALTVEAFASISATNNPQGILAIAVKKNFLLEDLLANKSSSFFVLGDHLQDPGNLGTIIRTSAAAGCDGVFLTSGSVDAYNPKVVRATMGGCFKLPIVEKLQLTELKLLLQRYGYQLVLADVRAEAIYTEIDLRKRTVLWVGNENAGPDKEYINLADVLVKIPQPGSVESLNVSVAASLIIYEALRQRSWK